VVGSPANVRKMGRPTPPTPHWSMAPVTFPYSNSPQFPEIVFSGSRPLVNITEAYSQLNSTQLKFNKNGSPRGRTANAIKFVHNDCSEFAEVRAGEHRAFDLAPSSPKFPLN